MLRNGASFDYEATGAHSVSICVTDEYGASHTEISGITASDVAVGEFGVPTRAKKNDERSSPSSPFKWRTR